MAERQSARKNFFINLNSRKLIARAISPSSTIKTNIILENELSSNFSATPYAETIGAEADKKEIGKLLDNITALQSQTDTDTCKTHTAIGRADSICLLPQWSMPPTKHHSIELVPTHSSC